MLLEDQVKVPIQVKNIGTKQLTDINIKAESSTPDITIDLEKDYIKALNPGAIEYVMATVTSHSAPGIYSIKFYSNVKSPVVMDTSDLFVKLVEFLEEKLEQILAMILFAKDLFKEHPECLELQELIDKADKAIENKEYEKARVLTETAILGCQDMITSLALKEEVPSRLPFTKQQMIILIVVLGSILALILFMIIGKGFTGKISVEKIKEFKEEKSKTSIEEKEEVKEEKAKPQPEETPVEKKKKEVKEEKFEIPSFKRRPES
jgi:hypothetical protein